MSTDYLLNNSRLEAGDRFCALSKLFDPWTFQHMERLGVRAGWRCWEVGAGGANVPAWLAASVGPTGQVIATDIDTSWASGAATAGVDIRTHDVAAEPAPAQGLDLVHARLVLVHVRERQVALRHMIDALRPGGWILIEDADPMLQPLACPTACGPDQDLANRIRDGFRALMEGRGVDLAYGRKLPALLREAGLVDIQAEAFFPIATAASAELEQATIRMLGPQLSAAGLVTQGEIERHLVNVAAGRLDLSTAPLITAWGRKP